MRRKLLPLILGGLLSVAAVAPAAAQPIFVTGGLVNVTIVDAVDVEDVIVQVPVAVAANICDVDVNVLILAIQDNDPTTVAACDADARSVAQGRNN